MTPEQAKKLLPIITAFAEGKTIQYQYTGEYDTKEWFNSTRPEWTEGYNYRIKPEKKTGWFNIYHYHDGTRVASTIYTTKAAANMDNHLGRIACIQITYEEGEGL